MTKLTNSSVDGLIQLKCKHVVRLKSQKCLGIKGKKENKPSDIFVNMSQAECSLKFLAR